MKVVVAAESPIQSRKAPCPVCSWCWEHVPFRLVADGTIVGAGVICPACGDVDAKVRADYAVEANRVLDRFILAGVYAGELPANAVLGVVEGRHLA